jgi:hypothetical protein
MSWTFKAATEEEVAQYSSQFKVGDEIEFIEPHVIEVDIDIYHEGSMYSAPLEEHYENVPIELSIGTTGIITEVAPVETEVEFDMLPYQYEAGIEPDDTKTVTGEWSGVAPINGDDILKMRKVGGSI